MRADYNNKYHYIANYYTSPSDITKRGLENITNSEWIDGWMNLYLTLSSLEVEMNEKERPKNEKQSKFLINTKLKLMKNDKK